MNISNIPGQMLLLLVLGVIAMAAVLAVALMRYFYRVSGHEQVY
jgi:NADH:ubiquinone oxidoreductase subunit K